MSASITVLEITEVAIAPNPVNCKQSFKVSVTVEEKIVVLEPTWPICGTISSGEEEVI